MDELIVEACAVRKHYHPSPGGFHCRDPRECEQATPVLRGVDLRVKPGEFLMILGPSGSGKSTLLNLLGLMDEPSSGDISLFGKPTRSLDEEERARLRNRHIGFVFQFDALLPEFTILENVMMPGRIQPSPENRLHARLELRARELMTLLDILPLTQRFPAQISGGERQRAAIARALVNHPDLLLADEPTGNLDTANAELVFNKIKDLADRLRVAVVLVTHNEAAARFTTRPIHLRDGQIVVGEHAR